MDKTIPPEALALYKAMATEYLEELLEEYFDNEGIIANSLNIAITVNIDITKKEDK